MATVITKFTNHQVAGLPSRIRGMWHILRINRWPFEWKPFDEQKKAFELSFHERGQLRTCWMGVNENFELVVTSADGNELPKRIKDELEVLAERSDNATSLYYPSKTPSPAFPLSGNVTFKASHW